MAQEQPKVTNPDRCRILVLDANIMLRAVLGIRVRSLIETYAEDVSLFIPSACVAEVKDYLPSLCARRNWDAATATNLLDALLALVRPVEQGFYLDFEESAKRRIGVRDIDDWPVVALALTLGADIWTEDSDFFGSGIATWTTDTVEIYLRNDPWQINEPTIAYEVVDSLPHLTAASERCEANHAFMGWRDYRGGLWPEADLSCCVLPPLHDSPRPDYRNRMILRRCRASATWA